MDNPLVEKHRDWRFLLREIQSFQKYSFMAPFLANMQKLALSAPVALSKEIIHFAPELLQKPSLRVLVFGGELFDVADDGCWYGLVPVLCGADFLVKVAVVGPEIFDPGMRRTAMFSRISGCHAPAKMHKCKFEESGLPLEDFDLIVLFQPGFESDIDRIAPELFRRLVASGKPVLLSAYHEDEHAMDAKYLEAHGYVLEEKVVHNPFFLSDETIDPYGVTRWGAILWKVSGQLPPEGFVPDGKVLEEIDLISRLGGDGFFRSMGREGKPGSRYRCGEIVMLSGSDGVRCEYVHLSDDVFANMSTGELVFSKAGNTFSGGQLEPQEIESMPTKSAPLYDWLAWSARVKNARMRPDRF